MLLYRFSLRGAKTAKSWVRFVEKFCFFFVLLIVELYGWIIGYEEKYGKVVLGIIVFIALSIVFSCLSGFVS
jgi:uncharacterized membrane protein (DUF373 family)